MSEYRDPVLQKVIDTIKAGTGAFKAFYYGEPDGIPASSLPAIVLRKVGTNSGIFSNAEDADEMRLALTVITDVRTDLGQTATLAAGTNRLYDLVEGRNADYTRKSASLLYILRHNVNLDGDLRIDVGEVTRVSYDDNRRVGDIYRTEANVEIMVQFTQARAAYDGRWRSRRGSRSYHDSAGGRRG